MDSYGTQEGLSEFDAIVVNPKNKESQGQVVIRLLCPPNALQSQMALYTNGKNIWLDTPSSFFYSFRLTRKQEVFFTNLVVISRKRSSTKTFG